MTNEQLGYLLEAFANFYWSVPISFVIDKVLTWHPEVTDRQFKMVLKRCNEHLFWHHCWLETDGFEEPELVVEHLIAVDPKDLDRLIAARIDAPYCECDEDTLLRFKKDFLNIPEKDAIIEFGKADLGLDDKMSKQLVKDCVFYQPTALCNGKSWVKTVLLQERFGKIHFRTVEQVKRFRDLGNNFYQAFPNPVLRGWRPMDLENAPALPDDIPEKDEEIPDDHKKMDGIFDSFGGDEKIKEQIMETLLAEIPTKKPGPNAPCPCGSGRKYKKCCGR